MEPIGTVPNALQAIVRENAFRFAAAFEGRLLTVENLAVGEEGERVVHRVRMLDLYGTELASYRVETDRAYSVQTLTATADGGFLFVLGFGDYQRGPDVWASDAGFASRVIKCDPNGALQFDTALEGFEGEALRLCLEANGRYAFFGSRQTPESKSRGVYSPTDVCALILDRNGAVLKSRMIGGTDYDSLNNAELSGGHFVLSCSAQSDDGDFVGSASGGIPVDWVLTLDEELEIIGKQKERGRDYFDSQLGLRDGAPVYASAAFFTGFDAGYPTAFLDYGDFFLVVSEHITGPYENQPVWLNSIWYYTETVYSGYDRDGKLLFRAAVDSSPDYDAISAMMNG